MSLLIETVLEPHGPATAIELDNTQVAIIGGGKRAAVVVTIGDRSAHLRLAVMGGKNLIGISKENRAALGVEIGDRITAHIALDTSLRTVEVPEELATALAAVPGAREAFDALSFTRRKELANGVRSAKRDDTRARRIASAVAEVAPK